MVILAAVAALYFNSFVLVVQSFLKIPVLHTLAPTGSEPAFTLTHGIVLLFYLVITAYSVMIAFGSRNSCNPKIPPSRPIPDCLKPPNGASGSWLNVLIRTRPA